MDIFVAVFEHRAELIGAPVYVLRPPTPHIVDRIERLFWRLIDHHAALEFRVVHD
jgi:hypothetical protein